MIVSPIPLFPVLAFYSENIFHTSNLLFLQLAFPIVITSTISLSLGICASTSYRYFKILPKWGPFILQRWKWLAASTLGFYFTIAGLFYFLHQYLVVDPIIIAQQLSDIPSLMPLAKEKTMLLKVNTRFNITVIAFIQTFAPLGFGVMLIHMYVLIKKRKSVSSKNTYNLQITLYWYMVFECLVIYFILIIPFCASLIIAVFNISYGGPISTVLFTIIIKPYRRAFQKYLKKLKNKLRVKKPHSMITVWFTSGAP
uniref:Uncharacterized protein n=1 Tax=Panagrolaimus sp. PS1159 TaxID=55785 RepID=A0AC35F578_9BILA